MLLKIRINLFVINLFVVVVVVVVVVVRGVMRLIGFVCVCIVCLIQ